MKKSIAIATVLVVGAGAAGVSAVNLTSPFQGSDTLFNVTRNAITAIGTIGPATTYIGGGSGNGQSAMANGGNANTALATQQVAPMSRMANSGNSVCLFGGGTAGANLTHASGIVVGLDAVDVLSSLQSAGQATAACNAVPNGTVAAGSTVPFAGGSGAETWKWALALVYGGKDTSAGGVVDCNSPARVNLVNNWSKLMQGEACAPSAAAFAGSGKSGATVWNDANRVIGGNKVLWHAYRRDEASGTSDVFASILGLSPNTSNSTHFGFGDSPYCNAMNWDLKGNGTATFNDLCAYGLHNQFTGPGGVKDPQSKCLIATGVCGAVGSGDHRKPPPGTWGETPDPNAVGKSAFDVLPTEMQDNDPVRRPCQGNSTGVHKKAGDEVCNINRNADPTDHAGTLGLVLPMVDGDFLASLPAGQNTQYPTNTCTANNEVGTAVKVFSCLARTSPPQVDGQCPNGDSLIAGGCVIPTDEVSATPTSQCHAPAALVAAVPQRGLFCSDGGAACVGLDTACGVSGFCTQLNNFQGRNYNREMRDGNVAAPGYAKVPLPALGPTATTAFTGAYYRIHTIQTALADAVPGCQMSDMTDQIGCLTATDPSSIGYAGDGAKGWAAHHNGFQSFQVPKHACAVATDCTTAPFTNCVAGFCSQNTDPAQENDVDPAFPSANAWETTALNIGASGQGVAAGVASVQKLGKVGEYQLARKLYLNSLIGFSNVAATTGDPGGPAEVLLAQNESSPAFMNPILTPLNFFPLGAQVTSTSGGLCEDFNEQTVCGAAANVNGCSGNTAPVVGAAANESEICGNSAATTLAPFEECDSKANGGVGIGQGTGGCSATCRCNLDFNQTTGVCN